METITNMKHCPICNNSHRVNERCNINDIIVNDKDLLEYASNIISQHVTKIRELEQSLSAHKLASDIIQDRAYEKYTKMMNKKDEEIKQLKLLLKEKSC